MLCDKCFVISIYWEKYIENGLVSQKNGNLILLLSDKMLMHVVKC